MGKCLVTKLQGTVENSKLLMIGESRVLHTRNTSDSVDLRSFSIKVVTNMTIKGHGLTIDNQNEVDAPESNQQDNSLLLLSCQSTHLECVPLSCHPWRRSSDIPSHIPSFP